MPVRRDADGNIIDERTRLIRQSGTDSGDAADRPSAPTEHVRNRAAGRAAGQTRIYRPGRPDAGAGEDSGSAAAKRDGFPTVPVAGRPSAPTKPVRGRKVDPAAGDPMVDPPVGWLVVIDGPGKGHVVTLGMGLNSIGRDRKERISLDFGDAMISRTNHSSVTYDPRGRKFYVQHGGGVNLTYINGEPVLAPRELEPLTHLQLGNTVLRFVPLCGGDFTWDDETERD